MIESILGKTLSRRLRNMHSLMAQYASSFKMKRESPHGMTLTRSGPMLRNSSVMMVWNTRPSPKPSPTPRKTLSYCKLSLVDLIPELFVRYCSGNFKFSITSLGRGVTSCSIKRFMLLYMSFLWGELILSKQKSLKLRIVQQVKSRMSIM